MTGLEGDSGLEGDLLRKMSVYRPELQVITRTREEYPVRISGTREAESPGSGNIYEFSREPYGTPARRPRGKAARTHARRKRMGLKGRMVF